MLKCPVCKSLKDKKDFIESYISSFNNQEYKLYHCKSCDLQWWEPLKIIPEFYEKEGEEGYILMHLGIRESLGENHKMFFKYSPVKSGRLLDVGCGDGVFLKEAQKFGFEVWGIDFDSKSIKVCQEKRGLKNTFVRTPWEFAEYCEKENLKFDVITFFEVLEHQDDPVGFLKTVNRMLKTGGYIAGSVPNRESWVHNKVYRELYHQVDHPPHHFLRFSKKALYNIFKFLEYTQIFISPTPIKILHLTSYLQVLLTGNKLNKFLRKSFTGFEYIGEGTTLFRKISLWRRFIFKSLKFMRNIAFFFPALVVKTSNEGLHLYFQAQIF